MMLNGIPNPPVVIMFKASRPLGDPGTTVKSTHTFSALKPDPKSTLQKY